MNFSFILYFTILGVVITAMQYDPHLRVGRINVNLPKTPPRNHAVKDLYYDAEIFAHLYDKRLKSLENSKRSVHVAKKFEEDFNKDLNNLKQHLRQAYQEIPQNNPTINDANLFQLVTEFIRKLAMIPMQTHCLIYGCSNTQTTSFPFVPPAPTTDDYDDTSLPSYDEPYKQFYDDNGYVHN